MRHIKAEFYDSISIAQLKDLLPKYSDNDIVSITISKKKKPNITPQTSPYAKPIDTTPLLPSPKIPTCQFRPSSYKLSRYLRGRLNDNHHVRKVRGQK